MTGLIIKDLLNLKKYLRTLLGIIIIYVIWGYTINEPLFLGSFTSLLFVMVVVSSFAYDEAAKWNEYALTLPIKRNHFIYSKYILSLLFMVIGTLISSFSTISFYIVKKQVIPITDVTTNLVVSFVLSAFYISLIIPVTVKLGVEKSRFISVAIFLVPVIIVLMGAKLLPVSLLPTKQQLNEFFDRISSLLFIILPIFILLFFSLSCFITCKIFSKKEY